MKFKVGDRVRVLGLNDIKKAQEATDDFHNTGWDDDMNNYCGNVLTIKYIEDGEYHMVGSEWCWVDEMLEDEAAPPTVQVWPTPEDTQAVKDAADKLLAIQAEEAAKLPLYSDPVNHPNHYASSGIECIEAIKASMTEEAFRGYLKGNVQKYLWRYEKKVAPAEDLKKASWYLTRLIEEVNADN